MSKRISIGVPVYNGENFLAECLQGLVDQDYEAMDVLISDNASTDATADICQDFLARDNRFRYVRQPENIGAGPNHNYVIEHTTGPLYKTATHDDVTGPGFLQKCADALDESPKAVVAFPRTRYVNPDRSHIRDYVEPIVWTHAPTPSQRLHDLFLDPIRSYLHLCYPVMGVVRREAMQQSRGIQSFQGSDAALLVELALLGDFAEVPEPLYLKRLHDDTSMRANHTPEDFEIWYNPLNAGRPPLPIARMTWSYTTSVLRAPLTPGERARCLREVGGWCTRERRPMVIGGELRGWARWKLRGQAGR